MLELVHLAWLERHLETCVQVSERTLTVSLAPKLAGVGEEVLLFRSAPDGAEAGRSEATRSWVPRDLWRSATWVST